MFCVTTPALQRISAALRDEFECLVFHATGVGGRSMEKLVDSGTIAGVVDLTPPKSPTCWWGACCPRRQTGSARSSARVRPMSRSLGALDMVDFGARETVPERFSRRKLHVHNPQVTLMRTSSEENAEIGRWIGERLNQIDGPVRFFIPELGLSALDAPGGPFWDPEADAALFRALEQTVRQTSHRQILRVRRNINEPEFSSTVVAAFRSLMGRASERRRIVR